MRPSATSHSAVRCDQAASASRSTCASSRERPPSTTVIKGCCTGVFPSYYGRSSRHPLRLDDPATDDHAARRITVAAASDVSRPQPMGAYVPSATTVDDTDLSCQIGKSQTPGMPSVDPRWGPCSITWHGHAGASEETPRFTSSASRRPRAWKKPRSADGNPGHDVAPTSSRRSCRHTPTSAAIARLAYGRPPSQRGKLNATLDAVAHGSGSNAGRGS